SVHKRFQETLKALEKIPNLTQLDFKSKSYLSPALAHIEENLGSAKPTKIDPENQITFLEARSPAEESREALRWLKGLIARKNIPFQECSIIVPDLSLYRPHLEALGEEFGMPLHFSGKITLNQSPLYAAINNLLRLPVEDYPRRRLIETINSPYFDLSYIGFKQQHAHQLDLISQEQQIVGQKKIWREVLGQLSTRDSKSSNEEYEEQNAPTIPQGDQAQQLGNSLDSLFDLFEVSDLSQSINSWISWLEDIIENTNLYQQLTEEYDKNAFNALRQVLRELVLAEQVVGFDKLDYPNFLSTIKEAAARQPIPEPSLARTPAISILGLTNGRGLRHTASVLMGLSEGIFPKPQKADPFLDENIRKKLGIESALDSHQFSFLYLALSRANQSMLLTRPYLAADGEAWQPSP
ncbi:MAG: exodeoxyribonuclease V subunit gamma, partial [Chloroflexota bacterium]